MLEKITCEIIPAGPGEWELLRRGERRGRTFASKREAIRAARDLATSYQQGEVVIRDGDGGVEKHRAYHRRDDRLRG